MSAQAIHDDLRARLGNEAVAYSRVTKYIRMAQFAPTKVLSNPDASSPHVTSTTPTGLSWQPLRKNRFHQCASLRELAQATHLSGTTVYERLINSLGCGLCHLRWVPHLLSDAQKQERIELSSSLLRMGWVQKQRAWMSRFCVVVPITIRFGSDWMKQFPRGHVLVQCKRLMVTIVWNPTGLHVMRVLRNGCKFNSSYSQNEILGPLPEWRNEQADATSRRLIIYLTTPDRIQQRQQHHKNSWKRTG
jgi:hypothetical protein